MEKLLNEIKNNCFDFLLESDFKPVYKSLNIDNEIKKLKLRHRKAKNKYSFVFDEIFENDGILEKGIILHSNPGLNPYYVFPVDGYKYLYCETIHKSTNHNLQIITEVIENYDINKSIDIINSYMEYFYRGSDLKEAIRNNNELIIYNIPKVYVVKKDLFKSYSDLIKEILS